MMQDPIADMLSQIKNASMVHKKFVVVNYSLVKENIMNIFVKEGYIKHIEKIGEKPKFKLKIFLKYDKKHPVISDVARVSKPGLRLYAKSRTIPRVFGGMGMVIVSTPQGMMTGKEAKKKNLGGEIVCKVW